MFGVNFVLALIVPGANPRAALQLPVIQGITDLLGKTHRRSATQRRPS